MKKIPLNNKFTFSIEPFEKKVRLVIYQNKEECMCRKETIKNIEAFLEKEEASIFKGRLQLSKIKSKIFVEVKKEVVGTMRKTEFEVLLKKTNQLSKQPNRVTKKAMKSAIEGKTKKYTNVTSLMKSLS